MKRTAYLVACIICVMSTVTCKAGPIEVTTMTEGKEYRFAFTGGAFTYVLRLWESEMGGNSYRGLGLRGPWYEHSESVNAWYQNAFMDVLINGKPLLGEANASKKYPLLFDSCEVLESGSKGLVQYIWERDDAVVRLRFMERGDCRALLAEMLIEPKQTNLAVKISASCFPNAYTTKHEGDRRMRTPLREEKSVSKVVLDPQKEWWALFCDQKLDMADPINRRVGFSNNGCAGLYLNPEGIERVDVELTGYPIGIGIPVKAGCTRLRFAFDELPMANAEAFKTMQAEAPKVQAILNEPEGFQPQSIAVFDAEAEQAAISRLEQQSRLPKETIAKLREQLAKVVQAKADLKTNPLKPISGEQVFLTVLDGYRRLMLTARRRADSQVRVFELRGPGYSKYKTAKALEAAGLKGACLDGGYLSISGQGRSIKPFPNTLEAMYQYDVFLMLDIDTRALATQNLQMMNQYIKDGGGLILFGGFYSYGASNIKESPLAEVLPFSIGRSPLGLNQSPENAVLKIARKTPYMKGIKWEKHMVSPWAHDLGVVPEAQLIIVNGDQPWLAMKTCGEGKTIACAGNLLGEASSGRVVFYDWESWPQFMGKMIRWISGKE